MDNIGILSINVHGLRDIEKRANIVSWLSQQQQDIIFLQETYLCQQQDFDTFNTLWAGPTFFFFFSPGGNHSCGVAILLKSSFQGAISSSSIDTNGRLVKVNLTINNSILQLINIYAPCQVGERADFFSSLPGYVRAGVPTIVGGDFNSVEDMYLDKSGGDHQPGRSAVNALVSFTSAFDLSDIFRSIHPSARQFTWTNGRVSSRLDKFYTSPEITENSYLAKVTIFPFSDHDAPCLKFHLPSSPRRGKGIWKFNTLLLENPVFVAKVKTLLLHWKDRKADFAHKLDVWWDFGKKKIRNLARTFSIRIARTNRHKRENLERRILELSSLSNQGAITELAYLRSKIECLDLQRVNGARIRAKELHISCSEKSSRYFFHLENKRQVRKTITKLIDNNDRSIQGNKEILDYISSFYKDLFSEEQIDQSKQSLLLNNIEKSLSNERSESLEGVLTTKECENALKQMKSDKSPGSDGLPAEFYKFFWPLIGDELTAVLNFCFSKRLMTESMRLAILSLLHKKNDPCNLKNWRPISLLNVDYKIGTKALASRLRGVLPFLLNEDQTCSVPGRSIAENLMLFRDIFDHCNIKNIPLAIIKIDQEKAFDRVNWSFLLKVLARMNFGPQFINFIRTLYTKVSFKVSNNGFLSRPANLSRGVRQGCPLSPLLYCLVAETLASLIRKNRMIDGFKIPGSPRDVKISQYADDTTLFLKNTSSVDQALISVHDYELGSGSKVNYDIGKSCGKWLGIPPPTPLIAHKELKWTTGHLEMLGLHFGDKHSIACSWTQRLDKLSKRLEAWSFRSLSLKGKALIINSLALSGLVYIGSIFRLPENICKQINRAIFKFLWAGKNELVARRTCQNPIQHGGLGIVDINAKVKALQLRFISHICNESYSSPWVYFARYYIGRQLCKYLPRTSFLRSNNCPHSLMPSPFYSTLLSLTNDLKVFFTMFTAPNCTTKSIYNQIISLSSQPPLCEFSWTISLGKDIEWKIPWLNSRLGLSSGFENDVLWKIYHRVLKTASYVKSWGLRISDQCDYCPVIEDIDHIFLRCPIAVATWNYFQPIIVDLIGSFAISARMLFFLEFPRTAPNNAKKLTRYLLKLCIHQIWFYRCERRFKKMNVSHTTVIASIRSILRSRIKTVYHSKGDLHSELPLWTFRGILCRAVNGRLFFNV